MTENDVLGFNPQDLFKNDSEGQTQSTGNGIVYRMRPIGSPTLRFTLKFRFVTKVSEILVSVVHYELTPYQNS